MAALLALNTVIVSLLQVWAVRGTHDLASAGRAVARAGALLAFFAAPGEFSGRLRGGDRPSA